ncbi:MAG: proline dehydrogenase family protein [Nitrospinota bacterium]|nr:proline dehydrogenase family protein [Nitrospinota bacterium]
MDEAAVEKKTRAVGAEIYNHAKVNEPGVLEALWWERQVVKWLSADQELKSRAMRFIDVFPSLKTNRQITRHLKEYMPVESLRLPEYLRLGKVAVRSALSTPGAAAMTTSMVITRVARWFIAGSTMEETVAAVENIHKQGMSYTLDLLGEATLSAQEGDLYAERYANLINQLFMASRPGWPEVNVSVKLSALTPHFDPAAPERASAEARERLRRIFRAAKRDRAWVNIDMENYALRDLTLKVFMEIMEEDEFADFDRAGIVAQAYLEDAEESLDKLISWVMANGRRISIRLVKGAYWEQETVMANQKGWAPPVRQVKAETDAAFERMLVTLFKHHRHVVTAVASHNIRSLARAVALAEQMGVPKSRFEAQMLYGMAGEVKRALVQMGVPLRVYAPFGEFLPGMAYLVRRILENSSNESFLRQSFVEERPLDELLENPALATGSAKSTIEEVPAPGDLFVNEPEPKFHHKAERDAMDKAIEEVSKSLGRRYKIIIDGRTMPSTDTFLSVDPGDPENVIGEVCQADPEQATEAMDSAARAFKKWSAMSAEKRTEILLRTADMVKDRKHELAAWQMFEVGKNRKEALADVNEGIDLIRYYALSARRLFAPQKTEALLGETNVTRLLPRGAGLVISPWNFPLAIMAGMTTSSMAAGNTVTLKPSSLSPVTAAIFVQILHDAGAPDGVVNFLPGEGSALGPMLMEHPKTSFVVFTGSYEVGAGLVKAAALASDTRDGFIKVSAEMGGKNAVIVDQTADLDAAVAGVVQSAFGFGGQKCSACSRVIALDGVYDEFAARLVDAAKSLNVAHATDPAADYGPLAGKAALEKVARYVEIGSREAKPLLLPGEIPPKGCFAAPAVFGDTPPFSRLARDEIFGPVVCLIRVSDMDEAISVANSAQYGLTGGVYSRTPSTITKVMERMRVGNLYINRGITGAVVRRQPFGGFKRSGLGSAKAGGEELIRELALPQTVSENIVRHGFSPDLPT